MNSIVLEVPIAMLTADGGVHKASEKEAVIGTYGATGRQQITIRRGNSKINGEGQWRQVNREGNSLINELIIGTTLRFSRFRFLQLRVLTCCRCFNTPLAFW